MKPKEYVKKYKIDIKTSFNHSAFVSDLSIDFISNIEFLKEKNQLSYERFKHCIKEIRQKFESIFIRSCLREIPEKLWKYFYATVIGKVQDELFGEYLKQKKKEKRQWSEEDLYNNVFKNFFGGAFEYFYKSFFNSFLNSNERDNSCFEYFGLDPENITKEDIQKEFRKQSLILHPDKGGDPNKFRELIEMKNKCLSLLGVK